MPKMDGWTASKLMKEMMKRDFGVDIPIIGVSGDDRHHNQEKIKFSGMDDLLQKPVQREELQLLLKKYV